jgi:hypothetical protein
MYLRTRSAAVAAPYGQATYAAQVGRTQSVINVLSFTLDIVVITYIWRHRGWYLRPTR